MEDYQLVESGEDPLVSHRYGGAEVVIRPRSNMIGEPAFPGMVTESGDLIVIAIQRNGADVGPKATTLAAGDVLLVRGTWNALAVQLEDPALRGDPAGRVDAVLRRLVSARHTARSRLPRRALTGWTRDDARVSIGGTARYATATHVPPIVVRAVVLANEMGFEHSCIPEHGRLLRVLAAGRAGGRIGERGTGCGVGLAWLVSGAPDGTFVSVERDEQLATRVAELFAGRPNVTVLHQDSTTIVEHGPFDLLALDGGGAGDDGRDPIDPDEALAPGGTIVVDDFTPSVTWPPVHHGALDTARLHWLDHPRLSAAEIRTTADSVTVVATRRG